MSIRKGNEPGADGRAACWGLRTGMPQAHPAHYWEMDDMDVKAGRLYYRCPGIKHIKVDIEYWE